MDISLYICDTSDNILLISASCKMGRNLIPGPSKVSLNHGIGLKTQILMDYINSEFTSSWFGDQRTKRTTDMPLRHLTHNSGTGVGPLFEKESMGDTQLPLILASLTFYGDNSVKCPFPGGK